MGILHLLLDLPETASTDDVLKALNRFRVLVHPDKHGNNKNAENKFKAIGQVIEAIERKRDLYDKFGDASLAEDFDPDAQAMNDGASHELLRTLVVSAHEAREGTTRQVEVFAIRRCPTCTTGVHFFDVCRACGGGGTLRTIAACSFCHGGRVVNFGFGPVYCPTCMGAGRVPGTRACPRCLGRGQVQIDCVVCDGRGVMVKPTMIALNVPPGSHSRTRLRIARGGYLPMMVELIVQK